MILLCLNWLFLFAICYLFGVFLVNFLGIKIHFLGVIKFVIATWVGLLFLSAILLLVALMLPIDGVVFLSLSFFIISISFILPSARKNILDDIRSISYKTFFWAPLLLLAVSYLALDQEFIHYDTGLYHFQATEWLSTYGTVPGLALLHNRFGFTTSWFALAAPFETGLLITRSVSVTGGFVTLIAITHFILSLNNIMKSEASAHHGGSDVLIRLGNSNMPDYFFIASIFICLPFVKHRLHFANSSAPDNPVLFLILEVVYLILMISNIHLDGVEVPKVDFYPTNDTANPSQADLSRLALLVVILAAGAVSIKLSAAPLLFIAIIYYCFYSRDISLKNLVTVFSISAVFLVPFILSSLITSGCPLYPSSFLCTSLPWSVGAEEAKANSALIASWARWVGPEPENSDAKFWFIHWLVTEKDAAFLLITSTLAILIIPFVKSKVKILGEKYVLAISVIGIILMIYKAPQLRFGLGYLAVPPALLVGGIVMDFNRSLGLFLLMFYLFLFRLFMPEPVATSTLIWFSVFIGCYFISTFIRPFRAKSKIHVVHFIVVSTFLFLVELLPHFIHYGFPDVESILLPPSLRIPPLTEQTARNFTYYQPAEGDQCFSSPLPCTPYLTHQDVGLYRENLGLGGGFRRFFRE